MTGKQIDFINNHLESEARRQIPNVVDVAFDELRDVVKVMIASTKTGTPYEKDYKLPPDVMQDLKAGRPCNVEFGTVDQ